MCPVADAADSGFVTANERAQKIRERLDALAISDREFEKRSGINRKAVRRAAAGEKVRGSTYTAVEAWLTRLERENGAGLPELPEGAAYVGDPAEEMVEVEIVGASGHRVVFKGPIRSIDALREAASKLLAEMPTPPE